MADIRDVHLEREVAVGQPLHPDGVIEIASRLAVNRDNRESTEIAPPGQFLRGISCGIRRACSIASGGNSWGR